MDAKGNYTQLNAANFPIPSCIYPFLQIWFIYKTYYLGQDFILEIELSSWAPSLGDNFQLFGNETMLALEKMK